MTDGLDVREALAIYAMEVMEKDAAISELKERNRKQDEDIIDLREAIRARDAEVAALREKGTELLECIGLLSTLSHHTDCGLPIKELGPALHREVSEEIAALKERISELVDGEDEP